MKFKKPHPIFVKSGSIQKHAIILLCLILTGTFVQSQSFKWYPGHYVYTTKSEDVSSVLSDVKNYPTFRGVQRAYFWEELEGEKDQYTFSIIHNDINTLKAEGRKLVIQIQYKTFNTQNPKIPAYLKTAEYEGGYYYHANVGISGQCNIRLWNANVRLRLKALITALADEFDDNPDVSLINMPESGPAKPKEADHPDLFANWSTYRSGYFEGLFQMAPLLETVFTNTPVIMYFNDGHIPSIESMVNNTPMGIGAPDVMLKVFSGSSFFEPYYRLIQSTSGKMPVSLAAQWPNWENSGTVELFPDPQDRAKGFYEMCRDVIGVNFMFWERRPGYFDSVKALWASIYAANPNDPAGGLNSGCPILLQLCVNDSIATPPDTISSGKLSAFWSFDDESGNSAIDSSGNGNDLSLDASVTRVAGHKGSALNFTGGILSYASISDAKLSSNFPSKGSGQVVDSLTIAAWVKLSEINDRSPFLTKESNNNRGFEFGTSNGYLYTQIAKSNTELTRTTSTNTLLETDRWYHVAMTYSYVDDGNSIIKLYIDGVLDFTESNARGPLKTNAAPVLLGAYVWSTSFQRVFKGLIDEVYVFSKVLSMEEISEVMNQSVVSTGNFSDYSTKFTLFPNPAGNLLKIQLDLEKSGQVGLRIYNLSGKEVYSVANLNMNAGQNIIPLHWGKLESGMYIVKLDSKELTFPQKMVFKL